jgi:hypothetical protein
MYFVSDACSQHTQFRHALFVRNPRGLPQIAHRFHHITLTPAFHINFDQG